MIVAADDLGFVDTTQELINGLKENDKIFNNSVSLQLLESTYDTALEELISRGYLFEFKDKYLNKVHLIRAWFLHNKWKKGLWTSYFNFYQQVSIANGEYVMKPFKEEIKEININQDNVNQDKDDDIMDWLDKHDSEQKEESELPFKEGE